MADMILKNELLLVASACLGAMLAFAFSKAPSRKNVEIGGMSSKIEQLSNEVEQLKVASEIHHALGRMATEINISLDVAEHLKASDPEKSDAALKEAKKLSTKLLDELRQAFEINSRISAEI